ncbi:MAG TPA: hypothetical protein VFK48_08025 [Usitatibacter sp.]|nr:hypothetical protein [Usitatibacter sp.]
MNHQLWARVAARVIALSFVIAGVSACGDRISNTSTKTPPAQSASPSAVVIGTAPAQPTGAEPPGTTPTTSINTNSEMSKAVESNSMPLPGQPNDHSNVAPKASQEASSADMLKSPAAAAQANNGERQERAQ